MEALPLHVRLGFCVFRHHSISLSLSVLRIFKSYAGIVQIACVRSGKRRQKKPRPLKSVKSSEVWQQRPPNMFGKAAAEQEAATEGITVRKATEIRVLASSALTSRLQHGCGFLRVSYSVLFQIVIIQPRSVTNTTHRHGRVCLFRIASHRCGVVEEHPCVLMSTRRTSTPRRFFRPKAVRSLETHGRILSLSLSLSLSFRGSCRRHLD